MFISDQILLKLKCGVDEYLCLPCVGTKHTKANSKWVLEACGVFNILSTPNFEYALQLQSTKNNMFLLCETSNALLMLFAIPKSIFISQDCLN